MERTGVIPWRRLRRHPLGILAIVILLLFILVAVFAPVVAPYSYEAQDLANVLAGPSRDHWFGTDHLGRDVLSRIIWGARPSISVGIIGVGIGVLLGLPLGMYAGYRGGKVDALISGAMEVVLTFPSMVLSIALVAIIGIGTTSVVVSIAVTTAPAIAVLARAATLSERSKEYVEATLSMGSRSPRVLFRHILPNILPPVLTEATLRVSQAILVVASLGFLGMGVTPPMPEWGTMLSQGRGYLAVAPHLCVFPGIFIALLVLGFNLAGDTLRDLFDPRLKDI